MSERFNKAAWDARRAAAKAVETARKAGDPQALAVAETVFWKTCDENPLYVETFDPPASGR